MKKSLLISAIASNHGKTLLSMALLHHFKKSVRPFKCGPDFIDPQFHEKIAQTPSVNLDGFMMNEQQLKWLYSRYFDREYAIVEGVMGYYDGMDKGASAYDVATILKIPSLLVLDASGSYITIAAVLKGMCEFRADNTISMVVLNKISSQMHYELVKKHIALELPHIKVCGWIQKGLESLSATHLGLDLKTLESDFIEKISKDVLAHIDVTLLESGMESSLPSITHYPFEPIVKRDALCVVVKDQNFSFLYHDNLEYLKECYSEVKIIQATEDESIPKEATMVILPGGYVETPEAYARIQNAHNFKASLLAYAEEKRAIYAECAGLIYLGESCDTYKMSGILPINFTLMQKRERLGYYQCKLDNHTIKGHAFHYTRITQAPKTEIKLYKSMQKNAKEGGFSVGNIFASYLHTMWRVEHLGVFT